MKNSKSDVVLALTFVGIVGIVAIFGMVITSNSINDANHISSSFNDDRLEQNNLIGQATGPFHVVRTCRANAREILNHHCASCDDDTWSELFGYVFEMCLESGGTLDLGNIEWH